MKVSESEAREVIARTSREMAEKCVLWGTPQRVADQLRPFVERGVNWLSLTDFLPIVLDPEDGAKAIDRSLELARILSATTSRAGSTRS